MQIYVRVLPSSHSERSTLDNCCSDGPTIQAIFGNQTKIKLDLFHAVQRINMPIKRKHMDAKVRKLFNHDLRMVFRREGDFSDEKRTLSTASPRSITKNLKDLESRWKDRLPKSAIKAIHNLIPHAKKGCLR